MPQSLDDAAEALESAAARLESEAWPAYVELLADGALRDPTGGHRIAELREVAAKIGAALAAVPAGTLPPALQAPSGLDPRGTFARVFFAGGRLEPGIMQGRDFTARAGEICRQAIRAIGPIPPWRRVVRDLERQQRRHLEQAGWVVGRLTPGDVPPAAAPPLPVVVISDATAGEMGDKPLGPTARRILKVLRKNEALSFGDRMTQESIAEEIAEQTGRIMKRSGLRHAIADELMPRGLLESRRGCGMWLSPLGVAAAETLGRA